MNFSNIRQNLRLRKMSITSVVISSFLFLILSDKMSINNIIHNLYNMQFQSPESIFMGAVNISRILSLQYSVMLGIGYIFFELATFVAIAIAIYIIIRHLIGFEILEEKREEIPASRDAFQTNDIYLQTSKFIC